VPNIHPLLVHFTIALFTASVAFDILGILTKRESLKAAGWWNLLLAAAAAIVTVITGLFAANTLPHAEEIHELMGIHETLGLIVLGLILVLFIWRGLNHGSVPARLAGVFVLMGIVGVGMMWVGAHYGGEMVYGHGMGVAPMMQEMMHEHHHFHEGSKGEHHEEMMPGDSTMTNLQHPDSSEMKEQMEGHHLEPETHHDSGGRH
jgi:uncharacterized membrane protein